jgi:hypothetical protein
VNIIKTDKQVVSEIEGGIRYPEIKVLLLRSDE